MGIDVQTLFTADTNRGLGLTTVQWLDILLRWDSLDDIILLTKREDSLFFVYCSNDKLAKLSLQPWTRAGGDWDEAVRYLRLDMIHFTSPLMFNIDVPDSIQVPYVCTVNDLIPLAMREMYIAKWPQETRRMYESRIRFIKNAAYIVAVSEATKRDIVRLVNYPEHRILIVNHFLRKTFDSETSGMREKSLHHRYIFAPTGYDKRKNNERMIQAFGTVGSKISDLNLVISGIHQSEERNELTQLAAEFGVDKRITFLDYVADEDLKAVYQNSSLVVFVSEYEGFGLPLLEAFYCRKPVLASNASSLPEICGDGALLVDPRNTAEIADGMLRILVDHSFRESLISRGHQRLQIFSELHTREQLIDAYRTIANSRHANPPHDLSIAWFSPLSPQKSGVSDYSENLIGELRSTNKISLFTWGVLPNAESLRDMDVVDYSEMSQSDLVGRLETYDVVVYHIGNNILHKPLMDVAKMVPGVVVLHDANLHGLFFHTLHLNGHSAEFCALMESAYGDAGKDAARVEIQGGDAELNQFPLVYPAVANAKQVIVHSSIARDILLQDGCPGHMITKIPHGVTLQLAEEDRFADEGFVIGVFGELTWNKQHNLIADVFCRVRNLFPKQDIRLRVVGRVNDSVWEDMANRLREGGGLESTDVYDDVSPDDFVSLLAACDVVINLRNPTFGETSGVLTQAISFGLPVLVSNIGSYQEYPNEFVWTVDPGRHEEDQLMAYLIELYLNPRVANNMRKSAKYYARENLDWSLIGREFSSILWKFGQEDDPNLKNA